MSKFKVGDIIKLTNVPYDLNMPHLDAPNAILVGIITNILPGGGAYDVTIDLFFSCPDVDHGLRTQWGISIEQTQPVLLTEKSLPLHNFKWTSNEDTD